MVIEHRAANVDEVRASRDGVRISGYAALFDSLSVNLGGFREKIQRGAFAESLGQRDQLLLRNHNVDFPLGRTSSGTLALEEERTGLAFSARLPNTAEARAVAVSIQRGDVDGMSFGFFVARAADEEFEETSEGQIIRTLKRVELLEVSTTPLPAYPSTSVAAEEEGRSAAVDRATRARRMRAKLKMREQLRRVGARS